MKFQMFKLVLKKAEEPEIKLPTSSGSLKKQQLQKNIYFCFIDCSKVKRRRRWHPTPLLLPGKSHRWRSQEGCRPWGCWGLDMTMWLQFHFHFHSLEKEMTTHSCVLAWRIPGMGEPLGLLSQGVTQSQTPLKRLSSSSSLLKKHTVYQKTNNPI